jgi:hypothetical protein
VLAAPAVPTKAGQGRRHGRVRRAVLGVDRQVSILVIADFLLLISDFLILVIADFLLAFASFFARFIASFC